MPLSRSFCRTVCGGCGHASGQELHRRALPPKSNPGWFYFGCDERDRGLEIAAVHIDDNDVEPYLLVIHVMPTDLRGNDPDA
jgi:hypothetical protein